MIKAVTLGFKGFKVAFLKHFNIFIFIREQPGYKAVKKREI